VFDWLFEGRTSVYVVLAALAVFLLLSWWQTRKHWLLAGVLIAAGAAGLYAILDVTVETDREQIVRKIHAMIASINRGEVDGAFDHISDRFRSRGGRTKEALRGEARRYIGQRIVERVDVWDVQCLDRPSREQGTARAAFQVKLHGQAGVDGFFAECDTTFDFDAEHGWRLEGVRLLKPQTTEEWPWQI
jgi:hypothetical protein